MLLFCVVLSPVSVLLNVVLSYLVFSSCICVCMPLPPFMMYSHFIQSASHTEITSLYPEIRYKRGFRALLIATMFFIYFVVSNSVYQGATILQIDKGLACTSDVRGALSVCVHSKIFRERILGACDRTHSEGWHSSRALLLLWWQYVHSRWQYLLLYV